MFTLTVRRIFDTKMSLASHPLCQFTTCSTVCSLSSPRGGHCHCMFVWSWSRNTAMAALPPRHTTAGIAFYLCSLSPSQSLSKHSPNSQYSCAPGNNVFFLEFFTRKKQHFRLGVRIESGAWFTSAVYDSVAVWPAQWVSPVPPPPLSPRHVPSLI